MLQGESCYLLLLSHQWTPPSGQWWREPIWDQDFCRLKLGFSEFHNNAIHSHLRTEKCLEKPSIETQSLMLASAQPDHLSCFYGKLGRAGIWLDALSKFCVALSAVSFLRSHQINFSLGWLSPRFRPVLVPVVFLFGVAHCFSGTLSCSSEMISRFSSFTFIYFLFLSNRVYITIPQCCTML